ncbi:carbohydrate ABC transporter permease [Paenibacillus ihuae]|uniref:carbohydrate ABC transporter permease n=1 Tax=Paenibacillus ihuae TaxID=1232431 RepID=UPI0006D560F5|nr:carbohydrate ABC transporter permease [Paenibacillus ihuae]
MRVSSRTKPITPSRSKWIVNSVLFIICCIWIIPTLGLFVSSFRPPNDIKSTGWWSVLPHRAWVQTDTISLPTGTDPKGSLRIQGYDVTDRQLRDGIAISGQVKLQWEQRRDLTVSVYTRKWTADSSFTLQNYKTVLGGKSEGTNGQDQNLTQAFQNTLIVAVPATVFPIVIATFAAYGFAWMRFRGRRLMFGIVITLLAVPLQIALIPIMKDFLSLGINGSFLSVWVAHTGFGLPLAIYFMYNYVSQLPKELLESAFMEGASHFTIFRRLIVPLSVPALASLGIFQFLWIWNDYLVSLIFIGSQPKEKVLSIRLSEMVGSYGSDWHLLTAGAFVSMILPLAVFFFMQRYFVRGLLGGSVKG